MDPCITNNLYSLPANLEEDGTKLFEANHYPVSKEPDTMIKTSVPQDTDNIEPDPSTKEYASDNNKNNTEVEELAIKQSGNSVKEEKTLDRDTITDYEQQRNPEWFLEGKPAKTPAKYMLIRNFILDYWNKHKPQYIAKSVVRKQMSNCGDVNSFGRVHSFLESAGYINVNCPMSTRTGHSTVKKPRVPRPYQPKSLSEKSLDRKRKKNHNLEMWNSADIPPSKSKRRRDKPRYANNGAEDGESDPYQLVPLEDYTDNYPAPFKVSVNSDALAIADFHSHLVLTEIIGLLGGTFETNDNGEKILTVKQVFPCKSTSTDIQCEMDPNSEMEAREWFAEKGLQVVGWYHSHPTFVAIPSIRDIENQMSYQDLFRIKETGDEPFIGLIINPYNTKDGISAMTYVHISNEVDSTMTFRVPYKCDQITTPNIVDVAATMATFEHLVEEYKDHQEKVDMSSKIDGQLATDICLNSLERFVHLEPDSHQYFTGQVRRLITDHFQQLHQD
ncbi:hypothetical protein BC941DRAFT_379674 [Chlamydoabsidia padenii]|nr:hypothetical protein BC941DRAFT_379674 [Chlamydoabsidia padenii]